MSITSNNIEQITCASALYKLKRKFPYSWDLNIYRGCTHGCRYCYAVYSHEYLGEINFEKVFAKINIAEQLDKELSRPSWNREIINIGGVTDSYQLAEKELKLMPDVLKVLIKHKTPAIISTKSDLVLRDYDLIAELAKHTYINIASTITTTYEIIREKLEPNGSPSSKRFAFLKEFRKTNASVGLHIMPIVPLITDNKENIESLCAEAKKTNVHYMLPGVLYLKGTTKKIFFDFIQRHYPNKFSQIKEMYKNGSASKNYKAKLYGELVNPIMKKYGITSDYLTVIREKMHKTN